MQGRQPGAGAAAPPLPDGVSSLDEWHSALMAAGAFHKPAALPQAVAALQLAQNPAWVHTFLDRLDLNLLLSTPTLLQLASVPGVGLDAVAASLKKRYLTRLAGAISSLQNKVVSGAGQDISVITTTSYSSHGYSGGYGRYGYGGRPGYGGGTSTTTSTPRELTTYSTPRDVASAVDSVKAVLKMSHTLASILPDGGGGTLKQLPAEAASTEADKVIESARNARLPAGSQSQRADPASLFLGEAIVAEAAFALY